MLLSFFLISLGQATSRLNPLLELPVLMGAEQFEGDRARQELPKTNSLTQTPRSEQSRRRLFPALIVGGLMAAFVTVGAVFLHRGGLHDLEDSCTEGWQFSSAVATNPLQPSFHAFSNSADTSTIDPMTLIHDQLVNPEKASGSSCQVTTTALNGIMAKIQRGLQCTRRFYKSSPGTSPDERISLHCEPYTDLISYSNKQVPGYSLITGSGVVIPEGAVVFVYDRNGKASIVFAQTKTVRSTGAPPTSAPPVVITTAAPKPHTKTALITQTPSLWRSPSPSLSSLPTISHGKFSASASDEQSVSESEDEFTDTALESQTETIDAIPEIARDYGDIYKRFLGGRLIYTNPNNASDQIILPFSVG